MAMAAASISASRSWSPNGGQSPGAEDRNDTSSRRSWPALRIALTVNHPHRDLAGVVLTAMALCRKGATCFITPANFQEWEIWSLAPDFVVLHYARRGIDAFVERLARAGIGFGVLDAEGGIWETGDVVLGAAVARPVAPRAGSALLFVGARPRRSPGPRSLPFAGADPNQQRLRFDFYHPSWRSVLLDEGAGGRRRILVNTNFSMVNPRFVSPDRNRENMQSVYGWDEARVRQLLDKEQQAIAATIAMVSALAADVPDTAAFVVRPHPFESPEPYRRALHHANVEVNADGPVQTQIARAAVVVNAAARRRSSRGLPQCRLCRRSGSIPPS